MRSVVFLFLLFKFPGTLCKSENYPAYYKVDTNNTDLAELIGLYQKTKETTSPAIGYLRPIYKKQANHPMYILQMEGGDWIITATTDKTGKRFGLKQLSNYQHLVDEEVEWKNIRGEIAGIIVSGKWACKAENDTKFDFKTNETPRKSSKNNGSDCLQECEASIGCVALTYFKKGKLCMIFKTIYNTSYQDSAQSVKIDCARNKNWNNETLAFGTPVDANGTSANIDVHKQNSNMFVVVSVICGLLVLCCALVVVLLFAQRRRVHCLEP